MYGRLDQVAGRWRLRFSRTISHPPEKVWRALTEPEHLAAWFPTTVDGERAVGAALRFTFPGEEAPPFEGRMLTYDWPSTLEFTWGRRRPAFRAPARGRRVCAHDDRHVRRAGPRRARRRRLARITRPAGSPSRRCRARLGPGLDGGPCGLRRSLRTRSGDDRTAPSRTRLVPWSDPRVAVVTGAALGIGRQVAEALAAEGYARACSIAARSWAARDRLWTGDVSARPT